MKKHHGGDFLLALVCMFIEVSEKNAQLEDRISKLEARRK